MYINVKASFFFLMEEYLRIVNRILSEGVLKQNRTGVPTYTIFGEKFEHKMSMGFPLLTTKRIPFRLVASELEFFIKGITDKQWLQERNNHIWDEWCNPQKVPYGHDEDTKRRMKEERDLGPIYSFQWRHFGAAYNGPHADYRGKGVDQLEKLVQALKQNPEDRRMVVTAWNPINLPQMALPPCHYSFQVDAIDNTLNLAWNQRSVDVMLGEPFNIAFYGLLQHLLAKESGLKEGKLVGFLGDVHVYQNHIAGAREQLSREPRLLPQIVTEHFSSIFDWKYTDTALHNYNPHPVIKMEVAV